MIAKALAADHEVSLVETARRDHATRLARAAAFDGAEVVVVLGGDGTLNEAANGLAGTETALAALPGGSTNVFARILGIPADPVDAAGWLLDALDGSEIGSIGLGSIAGRHFLFHCGTGFDAAVVQHVERRGSWKRWAGHPLFMYATARTWLRSEHRRRRPVSVVGADGSELARGRFNVILNANPYTYLGDRSFDFVPSVSLDSPLVVVSFSSLSLRRLVPLTWRALGSGNIEGRPGVNVVHDVRQATLIADPVVPYQLDGDFVGSASRLDLRWMPDALRLVTG